MPKTGGFLKKLFKKDKGPDPDDLFGIVGSDGVGDAGTMNKSGIVRFRYSYQGSIGGDSYSYELKAGDNGAELSFDSMLHRDYGELTGPVGKDFIDALDALIEETKIYKWDGFDKTATGVLDGDGFSLHVTFADGKRLNASGTNAYPNGYGDFKRKLDEFMRPETDKLLETARQKLIAGGLEGLPRLILMNFKQRGASGSDSYEMLLSREGVRSANFELRVKSDSGDFFPKGEYSYYTTVPDEAIGFEEFDRIFRKYDVIKWHKFDKAAKDYYNSEWFQMNLSYENIIVSARGTDHPDNYDSFRREFLEAVYAMYRNARDNYGIDVKKDGAE